MGHESGSERQTRRIGAVEISLKIFDELHEDGWLGVSELARRLDHSKSTIHSHLQTLADRQYVVQEGDQYRPGLRFLDIGEHLRQTHLDLYQSSREMIQNLAAETEETAWLTIEEHGKAVFLDIQLGAETAVTTNMHVGETYHLHCLAAGKAILSQLPDHRVEAVLDEHGLPEYTEYTTTDREQLYDELADVTESGVALTSQEATLGIRAVSAPITDTDGDVLGAVSVSGPTSRIQGDRYTEDIPAKVKRTANLIEITITYE